MRVQYRASQAPIPGRNSKAEFEYHSPGMYICEVLAKRDAAAEKPLQPGRMCCSRGRDRSDLVSRRERQYIQPSARLACAKGASPLSTLGVHGDVPLNKLKNRSNGKRQCLRIISA